MAAQASNPTSGQARDSRPAILPPNRSTPSTGLEALNASMGGFGPLEMVELSSKSIIEGILGPNKDGRVRNPVPSKLKGKTDTKKGNFGVMHMAGVKNHEVLGKDAAAERDAAARRTSENTASRAKAAQQEKYVPPKKRGLEATLNEATRGSNRGSPFARDDKRQARPLAPDETKSEQARLLTLLRSINPVTVVDQICKAVAYFGGIPGAPPPEDGIFPESANTRETGALFIGWLAEIFPNVTAPSPEFMKAPEMGKKKSRPSTSHQVSLPNANAGTPTEEPNSRNGYGYGPAISAPAWGLPTNLAEANPQAPNVPVQPQVDGNSTGTEKQVEQQYAPNTPVQAASTEGQNNAASASTKRRGRGRPKGSTNKKLKGDAQGEVNGIANGDMSGANTSPEGQNNQAQEMAGAALNATSQNQNQGGFNPAINSQAFSKTAQTPRYSDQSWQNHPQKNNAQTASMVPDELSPEERAVLEAFRVHGTEALNTVNSAGALPSPVASTKGPTEGGGVKRKRAPAKPKVTPVPPPKPVTGPISFPPQASPQVQQQQLQTQAQAQHAPQQGKQAPQKTQQVQQMHQMRQSPLQTAENGALANDNNELAMNIAKDSMQWASVVDTTLKPASSSTAPPPPKRFRQRKPKTPAAPAAPVIEPPSRTQTASVASVPTPTMPPSTIPDSQATDSQQSVQNVLVTRPPAEGLEAHYERFASMSQQQNGRSNTPTIPQHQQQQHQHVRQQSKTTSVPPQQTTPTIPQQMLHQKSQGVQQSSQRNDVKVPQDTTTRAPSDYYGQRSQSTSSYNQQYPSHQATQLYNTQSASPQLSNNNNTYRSNSTHTLANSSHTLANSSHTLAQNTMSQNSMAQASPQFSAAETYRTASPHVAQPSPSFTQTESNYRTTNTHNLAQPSSAFSQAENSYRTPAAHSMAQGTSTYSTARSHAQAPSTHYSQFSDSSYMDLPTLESLGHSGSGATASLGGYGQSMSVNMGSAASNSTNNQPRSTGTTSGLYSTANSTGLSGYDTPAADLLRVSRGSTGSNHNTHSAYGRSGGGLGNAFDTEQDMREQLLRGMGRR